MGIDATAYFGYGIKISDQKLIDSINEGDEDFEGKDFSFIFNGGGDEQNDILLCINKSTISLNCWEEPKLINPSKFVIGFDWDEKLLSWAKQHKFKKPKIGWWLCSSLG